MPTLTPYDHVWFRGKLIDRATMLALLDVEAELGYPLTILQAIGGAPASNGFHLKGRAVDLSDYDGDRKDWVMKDHGFIGWQRPEMPNVWGPHGHYVLVLFDRHNERGISPGAFDQIAAYDRREDGLVGNGMDLHSYRANPPTVYTRTEYRKDVAPPMTDVEKARDAMARARNNLGNAIAYCKDADGREVVQNQIPWLKETRAEITNRLDHMPAK